MTTDSPKRRALDAPIRPTRVEVNLGALKRNIAAIQEHAPAVQVMAIVKANAYGHGAVPVARALEEAKVALLGVALVEEGLELRNAGIKGPILVLGGAYDGGYDALVEHSLTPVVFREEHLKRLSAAAERANKTVDVHIKVDTGMGRIGVLPEDLERFVEATLKTPHLRIDGLLSHFANADLVDPTTTQRQVEKFTAALALLRTHGVTPRWRHLSNSAGVLSLPEVRDGALLNLVRPGLMLYGVSPAPWFKAGYLEPVLSWKTAIVHHKWVEAGTPISYGGTWVAPRRSAIATLPVGYADGYNRRYSSRAQVLVRGKRVPVVGRVCMDMCMVDVTDVPDAQVGDEVVLLGKQGSETIPAEELALLADTISYEILCGVGARVPRIPVIW